MSYLCYTLKFMENWKKKKEENITTRAYLTSNVQQKTII